MSKQITIPFHQADNGERTPLLTEDQRAGYEAYIQTRTREKSKLEEKEFTVDALQVELDIDEVRANLDLDLELKAKFAAEGTIKESVFSLRDATTQDRFDVEDKQIPGNQPEKFLRACFQQLKPTIVSGLPAEEPIPGEFYQALATACRSRIFYQATEAQRFLQLRSRG